MKVLIVDDEPLARRRLARLLARERGVEVVGEAASAEEAEALAASAAPDLVLLDIDMPGADGLSLARALDRRVAVVFTTAHRKHAVEAFEVAAVDYLLKPIDEERLSAALARVRATRLGASAASSPSGPSLVRLAARSGDAVELLDPALVGRLFASDKYTLCRVGDRELVLDDSLSMLEARLSAHGFFRAHRRELVNLHHVRALRSEPDGAYVELEDGQRAQVSRRALPELKQRLGIG